MQLEQVVTETHDAPLRGDFGEPPEGESPEAQGLLDLPEDRLDDHLATRVDRPACRGSHLLIDRKSTRLNSSHQIISYAVFCLKKKKSASPLLGKPLNYNRS